MHVDTLFQIIISLGASVEQSGRLIESGRVRRSHKGLVVTLRDSDSMVRRKFTAAHELGHVLCADFKWRVPEDEERWCDEFAGELLLPKRWLSAIFGRRPESLDTLNAIAARAQVSIPLSLVSAHQHLGWKAILLKFRFSRNEWRLWETDFVPPALVATLNFPPAAGDVLSIAVPFTRLVNLPLTVHGRSTVVQCEVAGDRSTRWVLIAPDGKRHLENLTRA